MANLLNRTAFLESKLKSLKYVLELNRSYPEIYQEKLKERTHKKAEDLREKEERLLLVLEIEALDNPTYLAYMTDDKLLEIKKKHELMKRKAVTSYYRKTGKKESSEALENTLNEIDLIYASEVEKLMAMHTDRQLDQDMLASNRKRYEEALIAHKERMALFLKHQEEMNASRLATLQAKLDLKVKAIEEKIQKTKDLLKAAQEKERGTHRELSLMPEDAILKIDHLTMQFGGLKAVDDLSFTVKKGEIFGLIGPNGAGKTTVFNCITQFYKATKGDITYRTKEGDVIALNQVKVHDVIHHGIVRTFQNVELIWELSILDNMLVGAHSTYRSRFFDHTFQTPRFRREEDILKAKAVKILTDLGLAPYMYFYPLGLPYGILKKVELARTLMTHPSLIILDEPAAGLNDLETEHLAQTIRKIQKDYDTTIFLVEHDMGLVMGICDTICAISFGKKLAIGTPEEIQKDPVVQQAYLGGE